MLNPEGKSNRVILVSTDSVRAAYQKEDGYANGTVHSALR